MSSPDTSSDGREVGTDYEAVSSEEVVSDGAGAQLAREPARTNARASVAAASREIFSPSS